MGPFQKANSMLETWICLFLLLLFSILLCEPHEHQLVRWPTLRIALGMR